MRSNKYPGKCAECLVSVAAGEGSISKPGRKWLTWCASCKEIEPAATGAAVAALTLHPQGVQVELQGFAGDAYWPFREATKAAKGIKVGGNWINVLGWDDFAASLAALQSVEGLAVTVDPDVTNAMRNQSALMDDLINLARGRLDSADQMLANSGHSLRGYQRTGVEFLATQSTAMLSDEMGLGKTVQTLIALPQAHEIRSIIVGPSVAKAVWMRELRKWRPDLADACTVSVLSGRKSFRLPEPGEILITNYEILNNVDTMIERSDLDWSGIQLIADEAHALKNPKAKRTQRFRALAERVREHASEGGRVWLLTATPLLGRPPELYALLVVLGRVPFTSFKAFAIAAGGVQGNWGWEWGMGPVCPSIAEALRPIMLRRTKADVGAELPPLSTRVVDMELTGSGIRSELDAALEAWDALGDGCPGFEELSRARALLSSAKIPTMLALIEEHEEAEEPLVVFSAHRKPIDLLSDREGWAVITGDTSPEERGRIQDAFQRGELRGVGATIKAGGVAITLTRASNAIMVDLDWTPALNAQAAARVHRLGSERPVMITNILADHALDARLLEILSAKSTLIDQTVEAARVTGDTAVIVPDLAAMADQADSDTASVLAELEELAIKVAQYDAAASIGEGARVETRWQNLISERLESRGLDLGSDCAACDGIDQDRRDAIGPIERWAAYGLEALSMRDLDRAQVQNGIGFNQSDSMLGHAMSHRVATGGLSAGEWRLAVGMLAKYHRQIGTRPEPS